MSKKTSAEKAQERRDVSEFKTALKDLHALSERQRKAGIRDETPAYVRANKRVLAAEKKVPWWRR